MTASQDLKRDETPNQRWSCMDCGAQFTERQGDEMFVHGKRHNFAHLGFIAVPRATGASTLAKDVQVAA
jgi:hypothetical protein